VYVATHSVLTEGSLWQVQTILYPGADGWGCVPWDWDRPWGITEGCEIARFIFCWDYLEIYPCTA